MSSLFGQLQTETLNEISLSLYNGAEESEHPHTVCIIVVGMIKRYHNNQVCCFNIQNSFQKI